MAHGRWIFVVGALLVSSCSQSQGPDADSQASTSSTATEVTFVDPDLSGVRTMIPGETSIRDFDPELVGEVRLLTRHGNWILSSSSTQVMDYADGELTRVEIVGVGLEPAAERAESTLHDMFHGALVSVDAGQDKVILRKGSDYITFGRQSLGGIWVLQAEQSQLDGYISQGVEPVRLRVFGETASVDACHLLAVRVMPDGMIFAEGETEEECDSDVAESNYRILREVIDGGQSTRVEQQITIDNGNESATFQQLELDGTWMLDPELTALPEFDKSVLGHVDLWFGGADGHLQLGFCGLHKLNLGRHLDVTFENARPGCPGQLGIHEEILVTAMQGSELRLDDGDLVFASPDSVLVFSR